MLALVVLAAFIADVRLTEATGDGVLSQFEEISPGGKVSGVQPIRVMYGTMSDCAAACLANSSCKSFNIDGFDGECQLEVVDYPTAEACGHWFPDSSASWMYCSKLPRATAGPCPPTVTTTTTTSAPYCPTDEGRRLLAGGVVGQFFVSTVVAWGIERGLDEIAEDWFNDEEVSQTAGDCVAYPGDVAEFCGTRHSHRLPCAFADHNLVRARDTSAHNLYLLLRHEGNLSTLLDSHPVCDRSVQDGICLDALPMCYCADMTACLIACNNVKDCAAEAGQTLPPELEATDGCRTKCSQVHPEAECTSPPGDASTSSRASCWPVMALLMAMTLA